MMINRRDEAEEECSRRRQTLKLRKITTASLLSLVCLVAFLSCQGASAFERRAAPSNADEDLQVISNEPIENLVTYPSRSRSETSSISLYEQELARCKLSKSKLLLSLVLENGIWEDVDGKTRSQALHRLSKFFAVPKDFLSLDDISKTDIYEMFRNSVKRGVHNATPSYTRKLGRLSFVVGCNNEMFPTGKLIASQIGEQMNEGLIDDITDLSFDWWLVWTQRINSRLNRAKRQATPEGSGDYYDDYDGEGEDEDPDGGITEVPVQTTPRHRHHHGDGGSSSSSVKQQTTSETTIHGQPTRVHVVDAAASNNDDDHSNDLHQTVQIDLSSTAAGSTASTESLPRRTSPLAFWSTTTTTTTTTTTASPLPSTTSAIASPNTKPSSYVGSVAPTLDPEMRESVSILESDINKTIENNDKKLKEEQLKIERILQQKAFTVATSSERSSYDLGVDFVTPIMEMVPEDERIEVIQTRAPIEFNFGETDHTPPVVIAIDDGVDLKEDLPTEGRNGKEGHGTKSVHIVGEDVNAQEGEGDLDANVEGPEVAATTVASAAAAAAAGSTTSLPTLPPPTTSSTMTTTESTSIDTTTTPTMTTTARSSSDQVTTTAVAVDNTAEATTASTGDSKFNEYDDDYLDPEEEEEKKMETPSSTPGSTQGLNIFVAHSTTTEKASPTTEYVEPEILNTPPVIKSRLPKQPLTAGKPFGFTVPMETFFDAEDGTNLKLTLLDKADQPLRSNSWIQFDADKREVYGLPLEEAVSRWQYKMHATDKAGESVVETLDLTVHQHKAYRSVNHEISIGLRLSREFANAVDWQLQLIRGIVEQLGDSDMSSILVREIRSGAGDTPYTFVFTNDTLPKDKCSEEELAVLLKRFDTTELNELLAPEIVILSVNGQQIGNCQKASVAKQPKPTPTIAKNYPPLTRNQVDRVSATVGQLLVFQVPVDTFYDPEDKTDLKYSLLTSDGQPLDARNWLQFDAKNREFYGIPLLMDVGQKEYLLVGQDSHGLKATDALVVTVNHPKQRDHNAVIQLHLNATVDSVNSPLFQRRFVERLAQVFGDADTSNIKVRALPQQYNRGQQSTFSYYNASIYRVHNQQCPDEEIDGLRAVLTERDGTLRDAAKITFGSEFRVFRAQFVPAGSCQAVDNHLYDPIKPIRANEKQVPTTTKDDYMMTFILPAAIILTMLVLGSIIACVLHRKKMTGKMELGDEEERRSFRSKGIPVIFHDELDEKPEIVTKSPIILKDEKPPLLPPSYNSTAIDGDSEDVDEYVPPPAVMMGHRESRGKSPVTPSYRKPPPYVSP